MIRICCRVALILATVAVVRCGPRQGRNRVSCDVDPTDRCAQKLSLLGDPEYKYPRNQTQLTQHCSNVQSYQDCIRDYANTCLAPYPKQVTKLLIYGFTNTNRKYCTISQKKQAFIRLAPCGDKVKTKQNRCLNHYIDSLQGISTKADVKIKIPMSCCKYYEFKECFLEQMRKEPSCHERDEDEAELIIDGYVYEVLQFLCQDYTEDSDKCSQLMPQIPKKDKNLPRPLSVLPPFVDILNSLPDPDKH